MRLTRVFDVIIYKLLQKETEEALWKSREERVQEEFFYSSIKDEITNEELKNIIKNFVTIFKRNFTESQVRHMNYKLMFLRLREAQKTQAIGKYNSVGNYNSLNNIITIVHLNEPKITRLIQEETFYHELLHMASTVRTKDNYYVGFEIPGIIGRELNEGYTEYLTRKYFTRGCGYVQTCDMGIIFAKGIENIIGTEKMQEYFFTGNIHQLIEDLSKYSSREDVIKLLFSMDRLDSKFKSSKDANDIIKEIASLNKRKLDIEYEAGILSEQEYEIEKIIKVNHYCARNLWSEKTKVVETKDYFYLEDQGYKSRIYKKENVNKNKIKCKQ